MGFFNNFPYTNFHQLNVDWILSEIKKFEDFYLGSLEQIGKTVENLIKKVDDNSESIKNFDKEYLRNYVDEYIATMIFPEISDSGYFIINIPDKWENVDFKTNGIDISIDGLEYGKLVINY